MSYLATPTINPSRVGFPTAAGDTTQIKVGSFVKITGAAPISQSITDVGFTPKALILFGQRTGSGDDTILGRFTAAIGFTDGTTEKTIWAGSEDNVPTSDSRRQARSAKLYMMRRDNSGALEFECDLTSFDADGFTINWTSNSGVSRIIKYIAIGGDDVTDVEVGSFTQATSTGVQNVSTGVANADFLMLTSVQSVTEDSNVNDYNLSLGVATSTTQRGNISLMSNDGVGTSETDRFQETDSVITMIDPSIVAEADFDGFTASGFDLDWTTADATARDIYYLTIKGGNWQVGSGTFPTATGTKAFTTSFKPNGVIVFGFNGAASATVASDNYFHMGASDGTTDVAVGSVDEDGLGTTNCGDVSTSSRCVTPLVGSGTTAVTSDEADVSTGGGFNATNFTLDFTKVSGTAKQFIWVVAGNA